MQIFLDSIGGGAWPFLVGGAICLVNSVNERDLILLNSLAITFLCDGRLLLQRGGNLLSRRNMDFLEGLSVSSRRKFEAITGL